MKQFLPIVLVFISSVSLGQSTQYSSQSNSEQMQRLLKETAEHYREAKQYQIAREQTRMSTGELTREWVKDYSSVASAPGGRYSREDKNDYLGWQIRKSDGVNQWIWEPWSNQYVQRLVKNEDSPENPAAGGWVGWLMNIDKNLAEGRFEGLETIEVAGRQSRCMVIVGPPGRGRPDPRRLIQTGIGLIGTARSW